MEARITDAIALAPQDQDVLGCAWGHCRATFSLLAEEPGEAHAQMTTGAALLLSSPATIAPPFLGLWPLLGAALDRDADAAAALVVPGTALAIAWSLPCSATRMPSWPAGGAALRKPTLPLPPQTPKWDRSSPGTATTPAASPLRRPSPTAGRPGRVAARGGRLLRRARRRPGGGSVPRATARGRAPVPRLRPGDGELPGPLRALGVTEREADVLRLVAQGLGNREIAERMFLSPRTVEKHVASLLAKTGLRRSSWLGIPPG